jgi:hypothetical protein
MLAIPPASPFRLTKEEFIGRIEQALNKPFYDRLTPGQQAADGEFHAMVQADTPRLVAMNERHVAERGTLTLPGGKVAIMGQGEEQRLAKMGALNAPDVVAAYRLAVGYLTGPGGTAGRNFRRTTRQWFSVRSTLTWGAVLGRKLTPGAISKIRRSR